MIFGSAELRIPGLDDRVCRRNDLLSLIETYVKNVHQIVDAGCCKSLDIVDSFLFQYLGLRGRNALQSLLVRGGCRR